MHRKKALPQLTSSKVVFRTFLVTLKQSYSSCITLFTCQHDFIENNDRVQSLADEIPYTVN